MSPAKVNSMNSSIENIERKQSSSKNNFDSSKQIQSHLQQDITNVQWNKLANIDANKRLASQKVRFYVILILGRCSQI